MPQATIFIVDDDISVRESLAGLLEHAGWDVLVFESAKDFLSYPQALAPGCLILDVSLPGLNGLELQALLLEQHTELPIIFITGHGDIPMSVQAMKAGAAEFLTKPIDDEALLEAVAEAVERSTAAQQDVAQAERLRANFAKLSRREREVMTLVAAGLLNKQVGGELGISEITVKAHRGQVMRKMQARSFAELVNMASSLGLSQSQLTN